MESFMSLEGRGQLTCVHFCAPSSMTPCESTRMLFEKHVAQQHCSADRLLTRLDIAGSELHWLCNDFVDFVFTDHSATKLSVGMHHSDLDYI